MLLSPCGWTGKQLVTSQSQEPPGRPSGPHVVQKGREVAEEFQDARVDVVCVNGFFHLLLVTAR